MRLNKKQFILKFVYSRGYCFLSIYQSDKTAKHRQVVYYCDFKLKVNFRSLHNSLTVPVKGISLDMDRVSKFTRARPSVVSTVFCYRRFN